MKTFLLFELKSYLVLGLFSKLFESTSEEPYNSGTEVFVVVVEGLGSQCSDPVCVFRFISPDLFFLSTFFKDRICAITQMSKFHLRD